MNIDSFRKGLANLCKTCADRPAAKRVVNKQVWVAGAGKSGVGVALLLKALGAKVFVSELGAITTDAENALREAGIEYESGSHNFERFLKECDFLVVSPGIPLDKGLALEARRSQIAFASEIEVASWFLPANATVIGVTGTNGKSTTTSYLAQLFANSGKKAVACGNIGLPFVHAVTSGAGYDTFIIELSSYQLESTYSLPLNASIILNIQNDHLARYETLSEYLKAKWRAVLLTRSGGTVVVDRAVLDMALRLGLSLPQGTELLVYELSKESEVPAIRKPGFALPVTGRHLPIAHYGELKKLDTERLAFPFHFGSARVSLESAGALQIKLTAENLGASFKVTAPCLPGAHNATNVLAASAAALALGLNVEQVTKQWESTTTLFVQLAHRLERIGDQTTQFRPYNGHAKEVAIYNDSKATNVESTLVAIRSFKKPIRLLLGGEPKGDSYAPLLEHHNSPIVRVYPFGKAGARIEDELASKTGWVAPRSATMLAAANLALEEATSGDVILLSPACASFDEFKNFEHRGDIFKEWANSCRL